ncbi:MULTISPECIES: acyltransferase [Methylobacterium]|uniref:Acyltransferase 3 domain-containing protein n=4 Tax=Pseudomonadota TaxID=1224 RepID=A0ABQ4STQ6_9HYPH|nr:MULTISPECIES: acyltransferase [Methylobacterium]PIU04559.1 MAG: acyltransferase [Methylobacterium sp. CG09_land_8_20_14_0_10_71_15]PIU15430.1 MAG: acyltransferase [Methylobacterium sp. CG08_land_8_20_14_0_20_71_15]GBU16197.1 acyltransferase [Methylobacterium sp.]GJE05869.1 hypothetical protein AOPFMNJM_1175 [Methylobacterium jeotgali]
MWPGAGVETGVMAGEAASAFGDRDRPAHPRVEPLPALTSLRFLAAVYVVAFHYDRYYFAAAPRLDVIGLGFTGVTFFFVLSGFILAYNYCGVDLSAPEARGRFYRARLARVYPLFLLSLALHLPWFAGWVMKSEPPLQGLMASGAVLAPLGLHAWLPGAACSLNCPSWSISVEIFFYALFPVLLPLVLRRPSRALFATLALWGGLAAIATLVWSAYGAGVSLIEPEPGGLLPVLAAQFIKYFPLMHLPEFMAGLLLFTLWQRVRPPVPVLLALSAAGFAATLALMHAAPQAVVHNGLSILAWGPLILAGAGMRGGPLCARPLVFLGKVSFALYLLHIPVYAALNTIDRAVLHGALLAHPWLGATVASLAALAAATLAHLLVEEPARRLILRGFRRGAPAVLPAR